MVKGEGRVVRHREASNRLANFELFGYIMVKRKVSRSFELNDSQNR